MRALFLGRAHRLDSSAMSNGPLAMFRSALERDDSLQIGWCVSTGCDDPDPHDRISLRRVLADRNKSRMLSFQSMGGVLSELGDWDVVLSNHALMAGLYREMIDTPLINVQMWTATPRAKKVLPVMYPCMEDVLQESLSAVYAPNLWESRLQYAETLSTLEGLIDTTWVREHSKILPLGVLTDQLDVVYEKRMTRDQPGMFWGAQMMDVKGWAPTAEVMRRVAATTGCRALMTTSTAEPPDVPGIEVIGGANRERFYDEMIMGDVFVCNSQWESYGIAWLEMLAAGLLGVYGEVWWLKHVLPDWYPFIASTVDEQTEMALALIRDWPDGPLWSEYAERTRQWVRQEHGMHQSGATLLEALSEWS